jgi:hypothetical protein
VGQANGPSRGAAALKLEHGYGFDRGARNVVDPQHGLERAGVCAAELLRVLPGGRRVAAPGAIRAADKPERSEADYGDSHLCTSIALGPSPSPDVQGLRLHGGLQARRFQRLRHLHDLALRRGRQILERVEVEAVVGAPLAEGHGDVDVVEVCGGLLRCGWLLRESANNLTDRLLTRHGGHVAPVT